MRLIQFSRDNPSTNQRFYFIGLGIPQENIKLLLEDDNFDPLAANFSVKPEICMHQMTHETILSCVRLEIKASLARKTQPWQNTAKSRGCGLEPNWRHYVVSLSKKRKRAKITILYNQAPHLTQDTNGKVTSQLDITKESQVVGPFPAGDHKASTNRRA